VIARGRNRWFRDGGEPELAAELRAAYRAGAREADEGIARTLAWLEANGLLENTLLAVVSDHGEAFGEHGLLGHGLSLYDELVRVPLLLRGPPPFDRPQTLADSVGLMDLLPTFLDWAGLAAPPTSGRSFLPVVRGEDAGRPIVSEQDVTTIATDDPWPRYQVSVRSAEWKWVADLELGTLALREEVYDLRTDPHELDDLLRTRSLRELALPADFCRTVWDVRRRLLARIPASDEVARPGGTDAGTAQPSPCEAE
jgi:arylsulfatase A-like enzyme